MAKLFVAVDLPPAVTAELGLLQPPRRAGVRLVQRNQMHLTLHYLGKAGIGRVAAVLAAVDVPAFPLVFEGLGRFPSSGGSITLWAGVRLSAELLSLHAAVADALAGQGFQPEARPYCPHVSLARCGSRVPSRVVDDFLAQGEGFLLDAVLIKGFGLYSSTLVDDEPLYRCEQSFSLTDAARDEVAEPGGAAEWSGD
jgi:2'-5' RNA ligase